MKISFSILAAALVLCCVTVCAQTWSMTPTVADPPLRRENPGAASATHMYVFGGKSGTSGGVVLNDLWQFDGTTWTQMTADGAVGSPPARDQAGITWDRINNKLIVFGGKDAAGTILSDTWEWDPANNAWTDVTPMGLSPSARRFCALAYDWVNLQVVLFGGLDSTGAHLNDTWLFDGAVWTQATPAGLLPNVRRQHIMVGRSDFFDVIMAGGQDLDAGGAGILGDTWKWDGINWTQIVTVNSPAGRVAIDAAYDLARQRIVIASGNPGPTGSNSEFDSLTNDWVVLPLDPGIYKCTRYFMAYIPATQKVYKVSGQALNSLAPANKTYENGLGLPLVYPGNGSDVAISVSINGTPDSNSTNVHAVQATDIITMQFDSPGGALANTPFLAFVQPFTTGTLVPGQPIPSTPASTIFFNPTTLTIALADGFTNPLSFFNPVLGSYQVHGTLPPSLAGTNTSLLVNTLAMDTNFPPFNLGIADAQQFDIQ